MTSRERELYMRHISLQQAGFTSFDGHPSKLWALTPLVSPFPIFFRKKGCVVSVALSLGLPPVAVSNCQSLSCPDFPPAVGW